MSVTAIIAGGSTAVQGVKSVFGSIFGSSGADKRNAKRAALSRLGFNLVKTPNRTLGTGWNIDDWDDQGLDNLSVMYSKYGQLAVRAHNERRLDGQMAKNINALDRAISELDNTPSPMMAAASGPVDAGGLFTWQNVVLMIAGAGALVGSYFLFIPKSKR